VRSPLLEHPPSRVQHRRDGGLVVRAEDRLLLVRDDSVHEDGLDRRLRRDCVEMRAEEDRNAAAAVRRLEPAEEVPRRRADLRAGVVLVDVEAELAQVERDAVGDLALLARRARQRGKVGEELDDVRNQQILEAPLAAPSSGRAGFARAPV